MNAIDLLEKQHRKVEAIFKKLEGGRATDPAALVEELANNLAAHMAIEQDLFYPAIVAVDPQLVSESFEEHSLAEIAIKRLLATKPDDDAFKARVTAAKELIEHHVGEEEDDLFKKVRKAMGREQLEELGKKMKEQFDEVNEGGYASVVPKSFDETSADQARVRVEIPQRASPKKSKKAA
jgi:iron-sulfur cluster repair protein YtfE (RIC family)